ncbi:hypothetical protein P378_04070 [Desulforamulus profundi]|uniref:Uncharacterized protein n=1 Tax=Desulforamulus profundi TaxID=1383067 RepID=A0A2C6MDJ4_9FIRM|nr:hypothetical protein [Desulforamulus profundi]PHJ39359.1 hypothetical protein P378_04070 [Desulforamulus profundi]
MNQLINLIYQTQNENWAGQAKHAFEELFGANGGRYPDKARKVVTLRAPEFKGDQVFRLQH